MSQNKGATRLFIVVGLIMTGLVYYLLSTAFRPDVHVVVDRTWGFSVAINGEPTVEDSTLELVFNGTTYSGESRSVFNDPKRPLVQGLFAVALDCGDQCPPIEDLAPALSDHFFRTSSIPRAETLVGKVAVSHNQRVAFHPGVLMRTLSTKTLSTHLQMVDMSNGRYFALINVSDTFHRMGANATSRLYKEFRPVRRNITD